MTSGLTRGSIVKLRPGLRGFDCNTVVDHRNARALYNLGYRFALRYVPRVTAKRHDLNYTELITLFEAGLAVMPVQHCELGEWLATKVKGQQYGHVAAASALSLGFHPGTVVWLDLESVSTTCTAQQVIDYCKAWYAEVKAVGFLPGLYVGWQCGLTPKELYWKLPFTIYWGAYNLDVDKRPAVAGICMSQRAAPAPTRGAVNFDLDINVVSGDSFGRLPVAFAPEEWDDRVT